METPLVAADLVATTRAINLEFEVRCGPELEDFAGPGVTGSVEYTAPEPEVEGGRIYEEINACNLEDWGDFPVEKV